MPSEDVTLSVRGELPNMAFCRGRALAMLASFLGSFFLESFLPACAQQRSNNLGRPTVEDNSDSFCQFDGVTGHKPFQCYEKRRYPIGTPCLCPGSDQIGKIIHR
jgi:hypothetical protein